MKLCCHIRQHSCLFKGIRMTPERKAEIDKQIAWWTQQEHWRIHGFGIVVNDPLFPTDKKCNCSKCSNESGADKD